MSEFLKSTTLFLAFWVVFLGSANGCMYDHDEATKGARQYTRSFLEWKNASVQCQDFDNDGCRIATGKGMRRGR